MKRVLICLLMVCTLSCGMAPLALIGIAATTGYVASEVVSLIGEDSSDTTLEIGEGGVVNVTNEAEELPDNAFGLVAYLLKHIYKVAGVVVLLWVMPSPQSLISKIRKWRVKVKEKM